MSTLEAVKNLVRNVPDFPIEGVVFRDITPLLADASINKIVINELVKPWLESGIDGVAAIESRGFIFGSMVAAKLGVGLHLLRKPGKLPPPVLEESYDLEYGSSTLQVRGDVLNCRKVLIVDDVVATGGTAMASVNLLRRCNVEVVGVCSLIDLPELGGSQVLKNAGIVTSSLLSY